MNARNTTYRIALALVMLSAAGCFHSSVTASKPSTDGSYLSSGTIIVSRSIPTWRPGPLVSQIAAEGTGDSLMAPVIGFIPPTAGFVPAENETWLEISKESHAMTLYRGKVVVKMLEAEGSINLKPGEYTLQHKQKRPLWYAPDSYFQKRKLEVPPPGARNRYLRGALGDYVLYPTTTFPIHASALWHQDVGGLKLSRADLSSVYYMLPIGSTIVVK